MWALLHVSSWQVTGYPTLKVFKGGKESNTYKGTWLPFFLMSSLTFLNLRFTSCSLCGQQRLENEHQLPMFEVYSRYLVYLRRGTTWETSLARFTQFHSSESDSTWTMSSDTICTVNMLCTVNRVANLVVAGFVECRHKALWLHVIV